MAIDHSDLGGYELFPFEPDWVSEPLEELNMGETKDLLNFNGTVDEFIQILDYTPCNFTIQITISTKLQEKTLFDFFDDHKGRWKRFWIKNPMSNFEQYALALSTATTIDIVHNDFINYSTGNERLYMDHPNGNSLIKKILSVTENLIPVYDTLNLNSAIVDDWAYNDPTIRRGLLKLVRLDQDDLVMDYKTDMTSTVTLKIKELNYEYPEV